MAKPRPPSPCYFPRNPGSSVRAGTPRPPPGTRGSSGTVVESMIDGLRTGDAVLRKMSGRRETVVILKCPVLLERVGCNSENQVRK